MNRNVLIVLLIVILVLLAGAWFFFGRSAPAQTASCSTRALSIVAFGDSLVEGYGATTTGGFVTMLSQTIGTPILNQGVSGNTTADALARAPEVASQKPAIVLVLLGGNDALQQVPRATTQANLGRIIETFQHGGAHVVLIGVLGGFPQDPFASMFSALAKQYGVTYVPNILSGIITNRSLMSDQIHPNDAGYAKIAARLAPVLRSECAKLLASATNP